MIANIKSTEGSSMGSLKKVIHAGSESIMFSVLQETQYQYPFKSSVREIVSNCLDSITEKNNFRKINSGEIKVEDLYIVKEGSEYSGSGYDHSYYDPYWLSSDDIVKILYIENDTETRDRIKFIDNGVALGGSRLINYFSLGYSSKRTSKDQLGSFGLGAKSLLSTGVDFYTVTSFYNGREYSFNVYKDHVESIISKFNEDGTINPIEVFFENTENEYSVFYRDTVSKNSVVVEAEVKRHRKNDFITAVENQLGFIPNVELYIQDANSTYPAAKKDIAVKVLFKKDNILVGEYSYYSVPQILLKPGDSSNTLISYGLINFEELEMPKYSGNVSFVLNINEVDVTPSRESVIWNSKTRDAVKSLFVNAQMTISKIIDDKLSIEKTLPDYLSMLSVFRDKNSISGLSELYKIIDVSKIENTFRGFSIVDVGTSLDGDMYKKSLIFTTTRNLGFYGKINIEDTNYASNLSRDYIARLSPKNSSKVVIYIGETKFTGIARYAADLHNSTGDNEIHVIYFKEELYQNFKDIIDREGFENFMDKAYKNKFSHYQVLIGELFRFIKGEKTKHRVIFQEDIDQTRMAELVKLQSQAKNPNHMSKAEKAKAKSMVIGYLHASFKNSYQNYYNEESLIELDNPIIYPMGSPISKLLMDASSNSFDSGTSIIGFSQENFKRFYKLPGIKILSNCLYTIEFGDLKFTSLGEKIMSRDTRANIRKIYENEKNTPNIGETDPFYFLNGAFKDFSVDMTEFKRAVNYSVASIKIDYMDYLKLEEEK